MTDKIRYYFGGECLPEPSPSIRLSVLVWCQAWAFTGFGGNPSISGPQLSLPLVGLTISLTVAAWGTEVTWSRA